jgi:hypothetical protein
MLLDQKAVRINASAFNWNQYKLFERIKMKSHFSNTHVT